MADSPAEPDQLKHDPLAALRQRSFLAYSSSRIFATLAQSMVQAVMAYQVYDITAPVPATGAYTATVFDRGAAPGGGCATTLHTTTFSVADTGDHWTLVGAGSLTRRKR